jgi:hypothetical protein
MGEIDRRTALRGMLFGTAFITAGGVAVTIPDIAEAVPLAAGKTGPVETDDLPEETDDLPEEKDHIELVQWWRGRRWRCFWRRGRRVCVRRW